MNEVAQIVEMIATVITTLTGVVMAYLAYQNYLKAPEQPQENEPSSPSDEEAEEELHKILVFKTSQQETWLEAKPTGLFCEIIDKRPGRGGPQWALAPEEVSSLLQTKSYHVNPGYKVRTGTFSLGPRRNWLYTKALFPDPDYLEAVLKKLMENVGSTN